MSLERKDVRFKLAADMHQALSVIADIEQVDIGEFVEMVVNREVIRRVHMASLIAERTSRLGISGNLSGKSGSGRE